MVQGTAKNENVIPDAPATAASEPQNAPDTDEKTLKRARRPERIALVIWLIAFGVFFLYLVIELIVGVFTFRDHSP